MTFYVQNIIILGPWQWIGGCRLHKETCNYDLHVWYIAFVLQVGARLEMALNNIFDHFVASGSKDEEGGKLHAVQILVSSAF